MNETVFPLFTNTAGYNPQLQNIHKISTFSLSLISRKILRRKSSLKKNPERFVNLIYFMVPIPLFSLSQFLFELHERISLFINA